MEYYSAIKDEYFSSSYFKKYSKISSFLKSVNWIDIDSNLPCISVTNSTGNGSVVKNLPASAGDMGSLPRSGRSPGEENGSPLQYSCLEIPMKPRGLPFMGSQNSQTRMSD